MYEYLCTADLSSTRDAIRWLRRATFQIGAGFHPDTFAAEYADRAGNRLFDEAEATAFDVRRRAAFRFLGEDVYLFGLQIQRAILLGRIR